MLKLKTKRGKYFFGAETLSLGITLMAIVSDIFVFLYVQEFGYYMYILFRARWNKGNHCESTQANQTYFQEHNLKQ